MMWDWIGGWASHALVAYLAFSAGILVGVFLCWYGDAMRQQREDDERQAEHDGHHHQAGGACPWCGTTTREDHRA